ncbi:RNB domain-containing ribonuclease [Arcanobacterium ihumii]|uniref:RNB domain-containing ribonuclease n=1 Tax=Arcanobacterium ihumii TaxID=2138162 RepID=UPI000F5208F9|nr:RNB domain-containing ribonuclease [Arcanobacterium ihumii]
MPKIALRANEATRLAVSDAISVLKANLGIPIEFSPQALAEASEATHIDIRTLRDYTDIPFVTLDPEGSRDLDQAVFLEETTDGFTVYYAIAALHLFVKPNGALDKELRERGQSVYLPDGTIPLHPREISEDAASLLPAVDRPAYVWTHELDRSGQLLRSQIRLGRVRSRAQLSYTQVQAIVDGSDKLPPEAPHSLVYLLKTIGELRMRAEIERGGISLDLPEQRIESTDEGFKLVFRELTAVENWNAQISLLTGMAAAAMMTKGNVGLLRILPPAHDADVERLRRVANALGLHWGQRTSYPEFLHTLDPRDGAALVFLDQAAGLFRGAGYLSLPEREDTKGEPDRRVHGAIAAEYAHVTAPLRRLADRYGLEVCRCLCEGDPIPEWVTEMLPQLPLIMNESNRRVNTLEKRALGAVEGLILQGREGEEFTATVIELKDKYEQKGQKGKVTQSAEEESLQRGKIMLGEPALEATVYGENLPLGEKISVVLDQVDLVKGKSYFRTVSGAEPLT